MSSFDDYFKLNGMLLYFVVEVLGPREEHLRRHPVIVSVANHSARIHALCSIIREEIFPVKLDECI